MEMKLSKPVYEYIFNVPVALFDGDCIDVMIKANIELPGCEIEKGLAKISSPRPVGRYMTVYGVRYTRELCDGKIIARRGELIAEVKRPWWKGRGRERIMVGSEVIVIDGELEEVIMTRGKEGFFAYCGLTSPPANWSVPHG